MLDAQGVSAPVSPPLRRATPLDFDTVLALIHEYYTFDSIAFDPPAVSAGLRTLSDNPVLGTAFLIGDGAAPAGYLIVTYGFDLEFGGAQATVTDLYLRPDQRGQGMGATALAALERFCPARGVLALELQVERQNARALAFYTRLGFQAHDRVPMSRVLRPLQYEVTP
jgi:GNAT superfamily N-acetyltransferase